MQKGISKTMLREYLKFVVAVIVILSVSYLSIVTSKLEILAGMSGGIVAYLFGIKTNKEEVKDEKNKQSSNNIGSSDSSNNAQQP